MQSFLETQSTDIWDFINDKEKQTSFLKWQLMKNLQVPSLKI